jgi:FHA domain-containing protein/zinc ribbon protein
MPQCPVCSSEVPENATFCPECGTDQQAAGQPQGSAAPEVAPVAPPPPPPEEVGAAPADVSVPAPVEPAVPAPPPPPVTPAAPIAGAGRLTLKRSGVLTGEVFQFGDRVVIGRFDPESGPVDVDLGPLPEATYISRHHAELWRDPSGQWLIKDLGSRNGTFVRSAGGGEFQRVAGDQPLQDGDEVALGNARFEFRAS